MTLRNVPKTHTLEQQRQEINLIASDLNTAVDGTQTFSGDKTFIGNIYLEDDNKISLGNINDFEIYHNGNNSILYNNTGNLVYRSQLHKIRNKAGTEILASFTENGSVDLYYNNSLKFETISTGAKVLGDLAINDTFSINQLNSGWSQIYSENPLEIQLDSGDFYVNTDGIVTFSDSLELESRAVFTSSQQELYYNNSKKFETTNTGVTVTGTVDAGGFSINGSPFTGGGGAVATTSSTGTVQPDGTTIAIDGSGVISVAGGGDPFTANGFKFGVNESSGPAASLGELRQIGGKPHFYDGTVWQEFILGSTQATTIPAETDWDQVLIRSTFDSDFNDVKFNAVGDIDVSGISDATLVGAPVKVGTKSMKSNGDGVEYTHRSEYDFTGTWTIEFWIYFDSDGGISSSSNNGEQHIISKSNQNFDTGSWAIAIQIDGSSNRRWLFKYHDPATGNTTSKIIDSMSSLGWNTNYDRQWVHIAVAHDSDGEIHLYENGVESPSTYLGQVIVNDINNNSHNVMIGGGRATRTKTFDGFIDDLRITKDVRYTGNGTSSLESFTPPTTQHPISGTTTTYTPPATSKAGEITLGATPAWTGTAGVTVTQQSSGNYRMTFTNPFTNATDYYVFTNHMDYSGSQKVFVTTSRSTGHVDFVAYREGDGANVDTGSIAVQVIAH